VVVVTSSVMPKAWQERLVRFLQGGGKALFAPILPDMDDRWQPCSVLRDYLGAPGFRSSGKAPTRLTIAGVENIYNNGEAFYTTSLPEGAAVIGIDERNGLPVAWRWECAGGGQATVLGFRWGQGMREHERMLGELLTGLGLRRKVVCSNPNVWTSLRTAGERSMLFLMNLLSSPQEASVSCRPTWARDMIDTGQHALPPMTVKCVELPAAH
jgi:hypothetical protein